MPRPRKIQAQAGFEPRIFRSRGGRLKAPTSQVIGEPRRSRPNCHLSRPNCHCSRQNRHNNVRRPLISPDLAVGQTVSGYFTLQDTPAHRPSYLSPVSVVTDMFVRPCPALVCFLGPGVAHLTTRPSRRCESRARILETHTRQHISSVHSTFLYVENNQSQREYAWPA